MDNSEYSDASGQVCDSLLVLCNVPDRVCAVDIARYLVEHKLAACVNILQDCQSIYRWEGIVQDTTEIPLLIKTTSSAYNSVQQAILDRHPYDTPEIIGLSIDQGLSEYLRWIHQNVATF